MILGREFSVSFSFQFHHMALIEISKLEESTILMHKITAYEGEIITIVSYNNGY